MYLIFVLPILVITGEMGTRKNIEAVDNFLFINMRHQYNDCRNIFLMLRNDFQEVSNIRKEFEKETQEMKSAIDNLRQENINFTQSLMNRRQHDALLKPVIIRKKWCIFRNASSKLLRRKHYNSIIDRSIRCITECPRAKVSLGLDNCNVDLVWIESEMNAHRKCNGLNFNKYRFTSISNHHLATNRKVHKPIKRLSKFRVKEGIFNSKMKYSDTHIGKVVTVMDDNRI